MLKTNFALPFNTNRPWMSDRMFKQPYGVRMCPECHQPIDTTVSSLRSARGVYRGVASALTDETLNAESATRLHKEMLERKAHPTELGEFYRVALARQLWGSQAKLAHALHVSAASVSRAISAANLPRPVLDLFQEAGMPSARMARALAKLVESKGAAAIVSNANKLLHLRLTPNEIFTRLCAGHTALEKFPTTSVEVITGSRGPRHLRIDSPDMDLLITALPSIRAMVEACLSMELSQLRRRKRSNIAR